MGLGRGCGFHQSLDWQWVLNHHGGRSLWCLVGLGLIGSIGGLLGLILNGLLSTSHEGTLKCVMPINITECTWFLCAQWSILPWGVLGWSISREIIGRVRLLTASPWLVISLIAGPVVSSLPLLITGGRLVGTVLLCEHLSQRGGWSRGGGLNLLH